MSLRGSKGELLTPQDEKEAILQHMQFCFHDPLGQPLQHRRLEDIPFQEADLLLMLRRTPARKSAPSNCCPSAFIKYSADLLAPIL